MNRPTPVSANPPSAARLLSRIPLPLRMFVYGVAFLGLVLVAVPWAFYQIDVLLPVLHLELDFAIRVAGAVFAVICLALYLASSYVLTRNGKGAYVEFDPPAELVIVGPYRFCRNPVVVTLLGTMLGEAIALSSTGVLLMFGLFAFLANGQVQRIEEPLLRERFGSSYEDYCARVPRWIPAIFTQRRSPSQASP